MNGCKHSRIWHRLLRYRCNLSPSCSDVHSARVCIKCMETGAGFPDDYGSAIDLTRLPKDAAIRAAAKEGA